MCKVGGGAVGPEPIDCSMYNCGPQPESGIDNDPFKVRTQVIKPQPAGKIFFSSCQRLNVLCPLKL